MDQTSEAHFDTAERNLEEVASGVVGTRDRFRKRGALGHLSFRGPMQV